MEADLIIIGGGLAGLVTANRAAELGCSVIILEQGATPDYPCNSRVTGGVVHFATESLLEPLDFLAKKVARITGGFVAPEKTSSIAADGKRALEWLIAQGTKFVQTSPHPRHRWVMGPLRLPRHGLDPTGWRGRAGDATLRALTAKLKERGGILSLGTKARSLIFENNRCVGVAAEKDGAPTTFRGKAIVLADGGFQGSDAMIGRFIAKQPGKVQRRNAATGMGDGIRMLEEAGAKLVGMKYFYGHLLARDALKREQLWPYPTLDALATASIVVNGRGERFLDEGMGGVYLANALAWSDDPTDAWVVFDDEIWNKAGRTEAGFVSANPVLVNVKGPLFKADSLAALESDTGLPTGALTTTVAAYNDAVANKTSAQLSPPRGTEYGAPQPVLKAPFYAVPMCPGLTFTMGGGDVDQDMRFLRPDGSVIEGLVGAGKSIGGLEGGETGGYVGGLSLALLTGMRAAESIARSVKAA
jgi:fumarate reductase flavoprotein subunit